MERSPEEWPLYMHLMLHLTNQHTSQHSLQISQSLLWMLTVTTFTSDTCFGNDGKHSNSWKAQQSTVVHTNHGTSSFGLSIAKWRAQNQCKYSLHDQKLKIMKNCLVFIRSWYWDMSWVSSVTNAGTVLQNRLPPLIHTQSSIHHLGITQVKCKKYGCVVANGN